MASSSHDTCSSARPSCAPVPVIRWNRTLLTRRLWQMLVPVFGVLCCLIGCNRQPEVAVPESEPLPPLAAMQAAVRGGDWRQAWTHADAVLIAHPQDTDVMALVAKVAFANDQQELSASLLLDAARVDSFEDPTLVRRAMVGQVTVGRLYEGLEMLSEALRQHPGQYQTRRLMFDFLCVIEEHDAAVIHGRTLVRQRQFDYPLLLELSNTEERQLEIESASQLVARNPSDKRLLLAEAKVRFDRGKLEQAEELLRDILSSNPDHRPAKILLGRTIVDSGNFGKLERWSQTLAADAEDSWEYWQVLGDWARFHGRTSESARAYWESTRRNPDVMQVWSKLGAALNQLSATNAEPSLATIQAVQRRATLLSRFHDQKDRFSRSGRRSKAIVIEIVNTLRDLGRLWEAEAWAAVAMTLPDKQSNSTEAASIERLRDSLISMLRRDTPWQTTSQHSELNLDLASLPVPSLRILAVAKAGKALRIEVPSATPDLRNEADERGLQFFGRTRDDLDQPGILIYAELGCGGGSIDFDLDGWTDLYFVAAGGTPPARDSASNTLHRNIEGHFVDVSEPASAGDTGFGQGVAVGDINEDGFPDLLLLNYGVNRVLRNNGDGTFTDVTEQVLPELASEWSTSGAIADIDGDGLPDMVVLNYCAGLEPVTDACTDQRSGITKSCAPVHFPAQGDTFFKGQQDGGFVDATKDWGVQPSILGRGLGVTVGSLDGDPGLDVFIANDMSNNHYYSQSQAGQFRLHETGMLRQLATDDRSNPQGSMGIATSDFDRDGDIDLYVTNFENEYNTYHQQRDNGIWQDTTVRQQLASATLPMVGFGTEAIDFDNDGILELVVANGHVDFPTDDDDADYFQPMQVFRRRSSSVFEAIKFSTPSSYLNSLHVGRALWTLDVNRDGRADFAVTHQTEPVALLVNHTQTDHHWIALRLRGRICARDAIGATVKASRGKQTWTATVTSGDGYLCSNDRAVRFGLGNTASDVSLSIRWPDGSVQDLSNVAVDAEWMIVQGEGAFQLAAAR